MSLRDPAPDLIASRSPDTHWSVPLDGLRGIAICLIVISHIGFLGLPTRLGNWSCRIAQIAWFGTDLFLAIAGYLCARSILNRQVHTLSGWLLYLVSRGQRVLPSYFVFLLAYLYLGPAILEQLSAFIPLPYPYQSLSSAKGAPLPYLFTASANLYYSFSGTGIGAALEALFAIGVGVQATVAVSACLVFTRGRNTLCLLAAFILTAHACRLWLVGAPWAYAIYAHPVARSEPFVWGALALLLSRAPAAAPGVARWAPRVAVSGWALTLALSAITGSLDIHHSITKLIGYPTVAIASAASVASVAAQTKAPRVLREMARLAPIAYAVFLFKLPWLSTLWGWFDGSELPGAARLVLQPALGILGALALATAWYIGIERRLGGQTVKRRAGSNTPAPHPSPSSML